MRGIVTVLNTPFDEAGNIAYAALQRHAEVALNAGVAGFLVPGLAAEVSALTREERLELIRAVVDVAAGKATVVAGGSAASQAERLRNAERLATLGCDVVLFNQPFQSVEQYIGETAALGAACALPLMIQDWSQDGIGVPTEVLVRMVETVDQVRYVKIETIDSGPKFSALKAATGGRLHVSGGWTVMQLIEALDRGVDAFMPTSLHRIYVHIYRAYQSGDRDGAVRLFRQVLPILAFANQHLEHSIHFFKRQLWRQGTYPTPNLRRPAFAFDTVHQAIADELIDLAARLEADLAPV